MKKIVLGFLIGFLLFLSTGMVNATTIVYSNPSSLGDYSWNQTTTISLSGLDAHTEIYINFDLFIMDSWDGNHPTYGTDIFGFRVAGEEEGWTFSNFSPLSSSESNTVNATSTGNFNSINSWGEIDRYFDDYYGGFTFSHSLSTLDLEFFGMNLQGPTDESWRVADLTISTNADAQAPVPEPATVILFGIGLLGIAGVSRKKHK